MIKEDRKILLVEDDHIDILTIKRGLKAIKSDHRLSVCLDGEEAMDYFTDIKPSDIPNLILLDLNLPKVNGFEFLEWIKKQPTLKRIPVIGVTTSKNPNDVKKCFELGISGYFVKPLDYFDLTSSIINYWEKSELAK